MFPDRMCSIAKKKVDIPLVFSECKMKKRG